MTTSHHPNRLDYLTLRISTIDQYVLTFNCPFPAGGPSPLDIGGQQIEELITIMREEVIPDHYDHNLSAFLADYNQEVFIAKGARKDEADPVNGIIDDIAVWIEEVRSGGQVMVPPSHYMVKRDQIQFLPD